MYKKTKILIIFTLILLLFLSVYKINKNKIEKSPPPNSKSLTSTEIPEKKIENIKIPNITLKINETIYKTRINQNDTVYDLMTTLQKEAKITFKEKYYTGMGELIEEINGIKNGEKNWIYYVNDTKANIGVLNYKIKPGDIVSWKYESLY